MINLIFAFLSDDGFAINSSPQSLSSLPGRLWTCLGFLGRGEQL